MDRRNTPKAKQGKTKMKYAIKLTNTFEDAYNQQHKDGLLSEFDINNDEHSDPHKTALFNTKEDAEEAIKGLYFNDAPDLEVVGVE